MTTSQLYRERAKEARDMAASASDHDSLRLWRQIAEAFEQLADLPARDSFWLVRRVDEGEKSREDAETE
jgi:hypothetical protein